MDFGFQARVDEDEGSPLRNGVNYLLLRAGEGWGEVGKSRDQRKPSGYASTRPSFPPGETLNTKSRE